MLNCSFSKAHYIALLRETKQKNYDENTFGESVFRAVSYHIVFLMLRQIDRWSLLLNI